MPKVENAIPSIKKANDIPITKQNVCKKTFFLENNTLPPSSSKPVFPAR